MSDINKLAERLRFLRDHSGESQESVAAAIGVERQTLGNYEQGKRKPDLDVLAKIKEHYNVDYDYLFGESTCQSKEVQTELAETFAQALSDFSQDTQTTIVNGLEEISSLMRSASISENEFMLNNFLDHSFTFLTHTLSLYATTQKELAVLKDLLNRSNLSEKEKRKLLSVQFSSFEVKAKEAERELMSRTSRCIHVTRVGLFEQM